MLITRKLINPSIEFTDVLPPGVVKYSYVDLCRQIDAYKNLLQGKYRCQPGQKVLIGVTASKVQTALIFACAELALSIVVVDYSRDDDFADANYIDPKTQLLLPIDFFIVEEPGPYTRSKYRIFSKVCQQTIALDTEVLDYSPNTTVLATARSEVLRCTSSGTTGTPKIVTHEHEFMYHLIVRNSHQFSGRAGLHHNLQHGSSFATYCMPILASAEVREFYNFKYFDEKRIFMFDLEHLMIPYPNMIEEFLSGMIKASPNLTVYTLSYIKQEWLDYVRKGAVKDFVSIFGSNETSGPVFLNRAVPLEAFAENSFYRVDDFYQLTFEADGVINVTLPYYDNLTICTNDKFKQEGDRYLHMGRSDLIRINGHAVDVVGYRIFAKEQLNCDVIYDTVKNAIYLAIWTDDPDLNFKVKHIDGIYRKSSNNRHGIDKHALLDYATFMRGVKIDHELLRDYFRNYV